MKTLTAIIAATALLFLSACGGSDTTTTTTSTVEEPAPATLPDWPIEAQNAFLDGCTTGAQAADCVCLLDAMMDEITVDEALEGGPYVNQVMRRAAASCV